MTAGTRTRSGRKQQPAVTELERFVELPREIAQRALTQPSILHNLAVACTRCGRWCPVEASDAKPDVLPQQVESVSVMLQDAVAAPHLPESVRRRSSRVVPSSSQQTYFIPNPQCFTCNWQYCMAGDEAFLDLIDPNHFRSGEGRNRSRLADTIPLVAQCCLCLKWRRVRRPHPTGSAGFCCALSPYAESRSCSAPENIEWLSDVLLSSDKLKAMLRRHRRGPKYMDPRHIRESRCILHRERVKAAPALFQSSNAGTKKDEAIDVDLPETISVSRRADATIQTSKALSGSAPADVRLSPIETPKRSRTGGEEKRSILRQSMPKPVNVHVKQEPTSDDDEQPITKRPRRRAQDMTVWVQCGKCDKWRVVSRRPTEKALQSWECKHRTEIPTTCADKDEADMEEEMLMRLGLA